MTGGCSYILWLRQINFISFGLLAWHVPAAGFMLLTDAFFQQMSVAQLAMKRCYHSMCSGGEFLRYLGWGRL